MPTTAGRFFNMRLTGLIRRGVKALTNGAVGASLMLVVGFVIYLEGRADLNTWHLVQLDGGFTEQTGLDSFEQYLALEDRLFAELETEILADGCRINNAASDQPLSPRQSL